MIEFTPLVEDDLPLLEEWLRREHVAEWWHDPLEVAIEKRREAIEGRRLVDHYVIVADGRPVGMIQTYLVADHPEWDEIVEVGPAAAGVDLLIGEPELIGRGFGPRVLAQFTREVVFANPAVEAAVATVQELNRRSWRAFEKAGFRHVRDVEEDGLPHRLMRLDRPA